MPQPKPFLWFDNQAEEAAKFYVSVFPNSKITNAVRYGPGSPGAEDTVMTVAFELDGQPFTALNGGPIFQFTEAVSFVIDCEDQAEVDHYWRKLGEEGGKLSQCGWLKDRFGVSWQVVPKALPSLLGGGDPEASRRAMAAMLKMQKLDIAALEAARAG
jgi:predicted 3-demethylubiquinone-9 3-methyltransferase (glyoxalase superfamily)